MRPRALRARDAAALRSPLGAGARGQQVGGGHGGARAVGRLPAGEALRRASGRVSRRELAHELLLA